MEMFTTVEMRLFNDDYFTIIRTEENYIEVLSNNTKHQWVILKKPQDLGMSVILYHKHSSEKKYYHKHWKARSVKKVVEKLKEHDVYVMEKEG